VDEYFADSWIAGDEGIFYSTSQGMPKGDCEVFIHGDSEIDEDIVAMCARSQAIDVPYFGEALDNLGVHLKGFWRKGSFHEDVAGFSKEIVGHMED